MDHIVQVRIPQIKLHAPFWVRKELDKLEKLYYILKDIEGMQPEETWQTTLMKKEVVENWQVLEQTLRNHGIHYEEKNRGV